VSNDRRIKQREESKQYDNTAECPSCDTQASSSVSSAWFHSRDASDAYHMIKQRAKLILPRAQLHLGTSLRAKLHFAWWACPRRCARDGRPQTLPAIG
jgi:hypothetical protein